MPTPTPGATDSGVPAIPDLNDPAQHFTRDVGMNAMLERRREKLAEEMGADDPNTALLGKSPPGEGKPAAVTGDDDTDAADAAAAAERARLEAEDARRAAAAAPKAADAPELDPTKQTAAQVNDFVDLTDDDLKNIRVRVVVNGHEETISGDELRRRAQKTDAADEYLEQTRTLLHEAKAIRAGASVSTPNPNAPATPAKPADTAARDAAIEETFDLMFSGQQEAAKAKFREIFASDSAKPVDVDAAVDAAIKKGVIKKGMRHFRETYTEIMDDPIKRKLADEFLYQDFAKRGVQSLEQLPSEDIESVLDGAGKSAMEWLGKSVTPGGGGGGTAPSLRDRLNRKKASDELPTASLRSDTSSPAVKSTTDKLNEMRAARGQPVA